MGGGRKVRKLNAGADNKGNIPAGDFAQEILKGDCIN